MWLFSSIPENPPSVGCGDYLGKIRLFFFEWFEVRKSERGISQSDEENTFKASLFTSQMTIR